MKRISIAAVALLASLSVPAAFASGDHAGSHDHGSAGKAAADTSTMTEGEIKKVDKEAGKITIKHGEIKHLKMPAMTMVFRAKDAAMLDQVKAGDKVKFSTDKIGGQLTLTQLETMK